MERTVRPPPTATLTFIMSNKTQGIAIRRDERAARYSRRFAEYQNFDEAYRAELGSTCDFAVDE